MYSSPPSNQSADAGAFSTAARSDRRGAPLLRLANGGTATERLRVSTVRFPSRLPCGEQQTGAERARDRFRGGKKRRYFWGVEDGVVRRKGAAQREVLPLLGMSSKAGFAG